MRERRGASVRLWIPLDRLVRTKFQFIVPNSESSRFEQVLRHWSLALRWISANVSLFTRMHLRSCIVWRYRTLSKYTLYNVGSCFNCCDSGERGGAEIIIAIVHLDGFASRRRCCRCRRPNDPYKDNPWRILRIRMRQDPKINSTALMSFEMLSCAHRMSTGKINRSVILQDKLVRHRIVEYLPLKYISFVSVNSVQY